MCGIFLYLSKLLNDLGKDQKYTSEQLYSAFNQIQKRGPDRSKWTEINSQIRVNIGFHRLAIMDLSTKGDQPFVYEKNNHTIYAMTNGEIYNHTALTKRYMLDCKSGSDCEVVPLLYMMGGIDLVVKSIEGEWATIIVDIDNKTGVTTVHASRDQFGVRPLFYSDDDNGFGFASELKGLCDISDKLIKPFPPANYLTTIMNVSDGKINSSRKFTQYYQYEYKVNKDLTPDVIKENIRKLLTDAVVSRLESDRPVGCLLSGGIDSSLVSAIAAKHLAKSGKQLHTFSIGMPNSPDVYYGNLVAKHIGSIHTVVPFDPVEGINMIPDVVRAIESWDLTTNRASSPHNMLLKYIRECTDIKVILSGEYADEENGGYAYFHNAPSAEAFNNETIRLVKDIYMYDSLRSDRCIASHGIEARIPFASRELIDFIFTIDPELRMPRPSEEMGIKNKIEKPFLREAFYGTNLLPDEVITRSKQAFSDAIFSEEKSWYHHVQEYVDILITDEEFEKNKGKYSHCPPHTKEALYYRQIFDEYFKNHNSSVIPYFWLPKWCGDILEPSARILDVYKTMRQSGN
jgi:asparagine synthase (glutamine-hydrolysing)